MTTVSEALDSLMRDTLDEGGGFAVAGGGEDLFMAVMDTSNWPWRRLAASPDVALVA